MTDGFRNEKVTYEIVDHIGVAGKKEINLVSWNDKPAKIDIREWAGGVPRKGITLTEEEAQELYEVLKGRYE